MMSRRLGAPLAAALLALPAAAAHADGAYAQQTYQICGGTPYTGYSGFALCASVSVTVETTAPGVHVVTLDVYNLSGTSGSYAGTVFTAVGLDNVLPPSIDIVENSLTVLAPCVNDPTKICDYSSEWAMSDDKTMGGGVNVDMMIDTKRGVNYAIASSCGVDAGLTPGASKKKGSNLLVTDCDGDGRHVTISFRVTDFFDPAGTGDVFIKGQNGFRGQSTTCVDGDPDCVVTPGVVVPEPVTASLLLTGLGAIAGVRLRRRRAAKS